MKPILHVLTKGKTLKVNVEVGEQVQAQVKVEVKEQVQKHVK